MSLYNKVDYETICAAVQGNADAMMNEIETYDGYLNALSKREIIDDDSRCEFVDETIKAMLQNKLIEATLHFKIE